MLILSRREDQEIILPGLDIRFRILQIKSDRVKIGILTPEGIIVHRTEVWRHLQEREALKRKADSVDSTDLAADSATSPDVQPEASTNG